MGLLSLLVAQSNPLVALRIFMRSGKRLRAGTHRRSPGGFMVLKVCPPLVIEDGHVDRFVDAIRYVVEMMHSSRGFWSDALGLARRAMNI